MIVDVKYNQQKINDIKKNDIILLAFKGSAKEPTEVKVKVLEIISDIQKCHGCGVRLDTRDSFKFRAGTYCEDCYNRRVDAHSKSFDRRKKIKW